MEEISENLFLININANRKQTTGILNPKFPAGSKSRYKNEKTVDIFKKNEILINILNQVSLTIHGSNHHQCNQ